MDSYINPFAPGAGTRPPVLTGRQEILERSATLLNRVKRGRASQSLILLGLRGVGKTVLLNAMLNQAEELEFKSVLLEASDLQSLQTLLVPHLQQLALELSRSEKAKELGRKALAALKSFSKVFKLKFEDFPLSIDPDDTPFIGNIEIDLPKLMLIVARAAQKAEKPICIIMDEIQYLNKSELSAFIQALHQINQRNLPMTLIGGGLPQMASLAGDAKSYAERLFKFVQIGKLDQEAAFEALRQPIVEEGATITDKAMQAIFERTQGYPYFLQQWGYDTWNVADEKSKIIRKTDVEQANARAEAHLDESFFLVRFDRCTPAEQSYLRAMAELESYVVRTSDVAKLYEREASSLGPVRASLINKGMIYAPKHGQTAFTVPLFGAFLKRKMGNWQKP